MKKRILFSSLATVVTALSIVSVAETFSKADEIRTPKDNITVSEAVTIASKIHNAYFNGKAFSDSSSDESYFEYAITNGIVDVDSFDDRKRNITRAEAVMIFSKSVSSDFLSEINSVTEIPDVPSTNSYFDELLTLYNAGIIMGCDDYGTFKPDKYLTVAEASVITQRISVPEARLKKSIVDANYGDAYYLINDSGIKFGSGNSDLTVVSAWNMDNRNFTMESSGLQDLNSHDYVAVWRDIEDVSEGLLGVEFIASVKFCTDGTSYRITDDNKNPLFNLETKGGVYYFNDNDTGIKVADGTIYVKIKADLDDHTAKLYMNGKIIGKYEINDVTASRVYIESSKEGISVVKPLRFDVYKDYVVNDLFLDPENTTLLQWKVTGGEGKVVKTGGQNMNDVNSAVIEEGTVAKNEFGEISGSIVFEIYMLLPENTDTGFISLNSGNISVAKLVINNDGVFKADGTKLRFHNNNIWQTLRIEADTVNGAVTYKINGKNVGAYHLDAFAETVDNITVGCNSGKIYFDDVTVHLTHRYDDYCPVPEPITDDGFDVLLNICSLWREGSHSGWGYESAYPDIEPALGYYDEGLPETADWEIKFMVENGIDVQHICWYCPSANVTEPIKRADHNYALHDGYFNAEYSDMMKFAFMWENSDVNCTSLEQFKEFIWPYWIDYYFLDDRYYTIDNKIVFTVWSYTGFKKAFGNTIEGAKEAVSFINEDIKKYGFDGVMIFFSDAHKMDAASFETFAELGGSAAFAYHWNQDGKSADLTIKRLDNNQGLGKIHVIPTASVGFNNIGWSGTRKSLITLSDHKKVLEHIKGKYLTKLNGWKSKTIVVSTWNEYGEGTYVMPTKDLHGFGYLENIAEVISGVTYHSSNIYPTEQQKSRLGHLYPDSKTSLERLDVVTAEENIYKSLYTVDCNGFSFDTGWFNLNGSTKIENDAYKVTAKKSDPRVTLNSTKSKALEQAKISADSISAIRIVTKVEKTDSTQIFFTTTSSTSVTEDKSFKFTAQATGDFVEYIIPTNTVATFEGTLKSFRFDIIQSSGTFWIKEFELLGIDESKLPVDISINNIKYEPSFSPKAENGEVYVTAEPDKGFFTSHNLYYEWSRFTGKLYISDYNNDSVIFTVGSDTAIVNSKEVKLAKELEVLDGIPKIPLLFMYDALGISYEYDKDAKKLDTFVFISEEDTKTAIETIKNRVPYEYEFNITGDHERFNINGCTIFVSDGFLKGVSTSNDPVLNINELNIDTQKYQKIVVGMKHRLPQGVENSRVQVFFTTDTQTGASESKSIKLTVSGNKSDEVIEYIFDFAENEYWTGTVKSLRVDPLSTNAGEFDIDYIRAAQ